MCSTVSTSPGLAVGVAVVAGAVCVCVKPEMAIAARSRRTTERESVVCIWRRHYKRAWMPAVSMHGNPIAHGCGFTAMLAFPPQQVVQVAAKLFWRTFYKGDFQTIGEMPAAPGTDSGSNPFGFNIAMPRNAAVAALIPAGGIN